MSHPEAEPITPSLTSYAILQQDESGYWRHLDGMDGRSSESALRAYLETISNPAGTYVAVPARSWRPVTVETVQTTTIKIKD